jgi:hypothetical protein
MSTAGQPFKAPAGVFDFQRFYGDLQEAERLQVAREEVTWIQRYTRPEEPVEVVLNLSCGVQSDPYVMMGQVALFEALGIDFVATAGTQFCCGRTLQRNGKEGSAAGRAWSSSTITWPGCGRRATLPFEVVHITRFVLDTLKRLGDAVPWRKVTPRRVLLHAEGAELHPTKEA